MAPGLASARRETSRDSPTITMVICFLVVTVLWYLKKREAYRKAKEAGDKDAMLRVLIGGVEDILRLEPGKAEQYKSIISRVAEAAGLFDGLRAIVREETHPEEETK